MLKVSKKDAKTRSLTSFWFYLLTLNIFHTFFYCFYCWLWTNDCWSDLVSNRLKCVLFQFHGMVKSLFFDCVWVRNTRECLNHAQVSYCLNWINFVHSTYLIGLNTFLNKFHTFYSKLLHSRSLLFPSGSTNVLQCLNFNIWIDFLSQSLIIDQSKQKSIIISGVTYQKRINWSWLMMISM